MYAIAKHCVLLNLEGEYKINLLTWQIDLVLHRSGRAILLYIRSARTLRLHFPIDWDREVS